MTQSYKGITFQSATFTEFIVRALQLKLQPHGQRFTVQVLLDQLEELRAEGNKQFVVLIEETGTEGKRVVLYFDTETALQASHYATYKEEEERDSWEAFMSQVAAIPLV